MYSCLNKYDLPNMICNKSYNEYPTYGTFQDIEKNETSKINIFPYPFYFNSNPFSSYPNVNKRRAGWSPEILEREYISEKDPYPNHCFQAPCNTDFTLHKKKCKDGSGSDSSDGCGCVKNKCINMIR